jgi:hypothetical protein
MVELIDYNIYLTPIRSLPCLEDVIQKGYSTDDEQNKTTKISVREHPLAIDYAMYSLMHQGISNHISFIQRHAVYYAISLIETELKAIATHHHKVAECGSVRDIHMILNGSSGVPFCTMTTKERSEVYLPAWCADWINSNHKYLNIPSGRLAVFLLVIALDKSTLLNPEVRSQINEESEWFKKYVNSEFNKCEKV